MARFIEPAISTLKKTEMFNFTLEHSDGLARAGCISTSHGEINTPVFMPVATQGSVKALDRVDLECLGTQIILGNAYHLYLRPGVKTIKELGGLHSFMNWTRPILTDSGGFQGFSLQHLRKITDNGITFKSHIDGSTHELTPESVVNIQTDIGSDVIMPLDVCLPTEASKTDLSEAMDLTSSWLGRSIRSLGSKSDQSLFGIVQGGLHSDLRQKSADFLSSLDLPGYAIGGLSVGETKEKMYPAVEITSKLLPSGKPRYLMGVGSPEDLVECVARGIDMFDCVLPTRVARKGAMYTKFGRRNVTRTEYKRSDSSFDTNCDCYACTNFSAGYIHHLFKAKEYLAYRLASIHNLRFLMQTMADLRKAIQQGLIKEYRETFWENYRPSDQSARANQALRDIKRFE